MTDLDQLLDDDGISLFEDLSPEAELLGAARECGVYIFMRSRRRGLAAMPARVLRALPESTVPETLGALVDDRELQRLLKELLPPSRRAAAPRRSRSAPPHSPPAG